MSCMSEPNLELTVLMPCLNEAETVGRCVQKALACIARLGLQAEVLVADNGSTDGSISCAEQAGARVVHVAARGYGVALYHGVLAARGRFIVMGDADDSYDFSRLDPFVDHLRRGADLVMGIRFLGGIRPGAMPWKNRYVGNPILSAIGRRFFRSSIGDFHCGLRGFSRVAFDRMNLRTTGMEFASEMVIKATLVGLVITEVPTTLDKDGRGRAPHLRPWRDGWRHLRFMLLYCPRWLFLYPGAALFMAGIAVTLWTRVALGSEAALQATEVPWLLGASVATLLGFQGVAFAFCARIYAFEERLLPEDPSLERMFTFFTLETGLVAGALLFVAGLAGAVRASLPWTPVSVRLAIPAATALCMSGQVIFTSFLLSFLGLRRR